jgi:L-aminopeptidase/D-esterase-like protein
MRAGPGNRITDVAGLRVGNASDPKARTGVTVLVGDEPFVASVAVFGGAPGTRDTELLAPEQTVESVDALVLSGGSAFGLDAAGGVMQALVGMGRGFAIGDARVPIVPAAILFDLLNGGEKTWLDGSVEPPFRALGRAAVSTASVDFAIGTAGAGAGATTATLKGGLGTASTVLDDGATVGALVAVNAVGSATIGEGPHFWAAPFEIGAEFGGHGMPRPMPDDASAVRTKLAAAPLASTTIAIVATDLTLTKAEARRLAVAAHDGLARAIWPAHTPYDGDLVFAVATGRRPRQADGNTLARVCAVAASTLARAVARGVHAASGEKGDGVPAWASLHGPATG